MLQYDKKRLKLLKKEYFASKEKCEAIKNMAEEIERNILITHEFYEDEMWAEKGCISGIEIEMPKRILKPFDSYLMPDLAFQEYLDLCHEEYKRAGIADERGKEFIPQAASEAAYLEAEKQLILYGIDIIPDRMREKEILRKAVSDRRNAQKVLDLVLQLEC